METVLARTSSVRVDWRRSTGDYVESHCGRWRITPIYGGCTRPERYELRLDDRVVGGGENQRECKEDADRWIRDRHEASPGPALRGDRGSILAALGACDQAPAPRPSPPGYRRGHPRHAGSSMSDPGKLSLRVGCTGCQRRWGEGEGQCSRCRRCLHCCGVEAIRYTCAWRAAQKTPDQQLRSAKAYERWATDVRVLSHNRRIV
jgi:hypothetical protein